MVLALCTSVGNTLPVSRGTRDALDEGFDGCENEGLNDFGVQLVKVLRSSWFITVESGD